MSVISPSPVELKVLGPSVIPLSVAVELSEGGEYYPEYDGAYEVSPSFEKTILQTKNKYLAKDVSVNPIHVSKTTNPSGGNTVYIGG